MFVYQSAAYLRGEGIKSIVTFGAPVDIHKNLLAVRSDVAGALARTLSPAFSAVLARVEGLPGKVTSTAFKLVSTRKEVQQRIAFVRSLHDRERIMKREARRRFLGGEGFVAWPGPALAEFVDNFIVHNRMLAGGFVIDGHAVSLADLTCPILAFMGRTDEIARPATIRAIVDAAPHASVRFITVRAGHFGIVIGGEANRTTWPSVATWIREIDGGATASEALPDAEVIDEQQHKDFEDDMDPGDLDLELDLFVDVVGRGVRNVWRRIGDSLTRARDTADAVRWQEPRLRRLARIEPDTRVSASRELACRAKETPEGTFFIWRGRAFSYAEADTRVTNVARGLWSCGVRPGERVAVLMGTRPSMLSACTALGRLGAIAVVAPPTASRRALRAVFSRLGIERVIADPERAESAMILGPEVFVLGIEGRMPVPEGATDMEAIDPSVIALPDELELDAGRARDVANVLLRPAEDDLELRAVPITNHRWALSAIGAAAACAIKPGDTVSCAVPLHHPTGLLVSAGAALVGGARLALADLEDSEHAPAPNAPHYAERLLLEIRRVGATVVFYAGEMLRPLLAEPVSRADRHLPVRIVAGSGMRPALAARIRERFGVDTMEFYAGTAHRSILADAAGDEPGSLGTVLPGSADVLLVKCDMTTKAQAVDTRGHLIVVGDNEPGLLAVRVWEDEIETLGETRGLVSNAFGDGATWLVTNDVLERDPRGKYWFVDSLSGFVTTPDANSVSLRRVEDALYALPEVRLAAAWETSPGSGEIAAAFVASDGLDLARLGGAFDTLPPLAWPTTIARLDEIPVTDGFRPNKHIARELAAKATTRWRRANDRYELI
jgi:putative long chain acyl-CoA synthase